MFLLPSERSTYRKNISPQVVALLAGAEDAEDGNLEAEDSLGPKRRRVSKLSRSVSKKGRPGAETPIGESVQLRNG